MAWLPGAAGSHVLIGVLHGYRLRREAMPQFREAMPQFREAMPQLNELKVIGNDF
jgi:hypothetical protein